MNGLSAVRCPGGRWLPALLTLTLLLTASLAGCSKAGASRPAPAPTADSGATLPAVTQVDQPYFVLRPGTVYIYRTPSGGEIRMEVQAPAELADLGSGRKVTGYQLVTEEETLYLTIQEPDWVMEVGDSGEGGGAVYKTAKPEFPLHPQVGQSWTKSFADEFEGAGSFISTVTGFETVQTKAGTFEQAARVEVTFQAPDGSKDQWTEWYAPGVGRVKTSNGLELVRVEWPR